MKSKIKKWGLSLFLFGLIVVSYQRNTIWHSEVSLWADVIKKSPSKVRPHFNLGLAYLNAERFSEAEKHFRIVLRLYPDYHKAKYFLAESLFRLGSYEEALKYLKEVEFLYVNVLPFFPEKWEGVSMAFREADLYNNIGSCYYFLNNLPAAEEYYRKALQKDRFHLQAIQGFITVLVDKGRMEESIKFLKEILIEMPPSKEKERLIEILKELQK